MKTVELVKDKPSVGLPVGYVYEWTYVSCPDDIAPGRALRAFKRDHPGENPMCWKVRTA